MLVLTVGYVDMTTYSLTKYYYIIERLYLIYRWPLLLISTFSYLLFYIQYHEVIWEITSMPVQIFYFILCSLLLTQWRNIRLFYTIFAVATQNRSRFEPDPAPTSLPAPYSVFVDTPLIREASDCEILL